MNRSEWHHRWAVRWNNNTQVTHGHVVSKNVVRTSEQVELSEKNKVYKPSVIFHQSAAGKSPQPVITDYLNTSGCCSIVSSRYSSREAEALHGVNKCLQSAAWCKQVFTKLCLEAQQLLKWVVPFTDRERSRRMWRPLVNKNFHLTYPFKKENRKPQIIHHAKELKEDGDQQV